MITGCSTPQKPNERAIVINSLFIEEVLELPNHQASGNRKAGFPLLWTPAVSCYRNIKRPHGLHYKSLTDKYLSTEKGVGAISFKKGCQAKNLLRTAAFWRWCFLLWHKQQPTSSYMLGTEEGPYKQTEDTESSQVLFLFAMATLLFYLPFLFRDLCFSV